MKVSDLKLNAVDAADATVEEIYAKYDPDYAVYRTKARVLVHFADDHGVEQKQRSSIAPLNPLRGEINGLIDGWRASNSDFKKSKARRFERRVADALIVALQDDVPSAKLVLQETKADLMEERQSAGRVWYLAGATVAVTTILVLLALGTLAWIAIQGGQACKWATSGAWSIGELLALAVATGAVGALTSVALFIRDRAVLTDLRSLDNVVDAVLRIFVGAVSAPVLVCILLSKLISFNIDGKAVALVSTSGDSWTIVLVIAFMAGFLERLVPDLLTKSAAAAVKPQPSETILTGKPAATTTATSTGTNGGASMANVPPTPDPDLTDGCASGHDSNPSDATSDANLPPAIGG